MHSLPIEQLSEKGFVGLMIWVSLAPAAVHGAWTSRQRLRARWNIQTAGIAAFAALLAAGLLDLTFLKDWVVWMFFLLCGLLFSEVPARRYRSGDRPKPASASAARAATLATTEATGPCRPSA